MDSTNLHAKLLAWYEEKKRPMPWRNTTDPYAIWVSEVMLQQTQVSVVIPYWERWMQCFPTVQALANAEEEDVLSCWQGLGYYRRAKNLLKGAQQLADHEVPRSADQWMAVPGVGKYTANAIASIAFGEAVAVVDGNVERVYARLKGDSNCGRELTKSSWEWASANLSIFDPGSWNQALMELGATVCTPMSPNCSACPLQDDCVAFLQGRTGKLPVRQIPAAVVRLKETRWLMLCNNQIALVQNKRGQWWVGMWVLPASELPPCEGPIEDLGTVLYTVTNHKVAATIKLIRCEECSPSYSWFQGEDLQAIPVPAPVRKALRLV